jgi:hypothetical protein
MEAKKTFTILVPYNGIMSIATAENVDNIIELVYRVKFDNGFITEFNTYEPESEDQVGWNESGFGETQLARDVGAAIDFYDSNEVEPFQIEVAGKKYFVLATDEKDQVFYHVFQNKFICALALNEEAAWEANSNVDEALVRALGSAIESHVA